MVEVRALQPYRNLGSNSSPVRTILRVTTSSPWHTLPLSLIHGEFFTALVAFTYMIMELLVIMLNTVPYETNEKIEIYYASVYLCLGILSFQLLVLGAYFAWWRRTGPKLPRHPDTLAGVWSFLAKSQMRRDFEDLSTVKKKDLIRTVGGGGWEKDVLYWMDSR